ncbi:MAG TPA: flippase [Syntrophorhabdaceae bacterium]|nr:flippase [Syntrophorhabdaceae bacterium]
MSLEKKYLINVFAQGMGRIFTFGTNFLVFALIARVFGGDFFGKYSYVLNFMAIMIAFSDFGFSSILGKDISQLKDSPRIYWGNYLIVRMLFNCIIIVISIITAYYIRRDMLDLLLLSSLALPFLTSRFFEPIFQVFGRPWHSFYSSVFYGISYIIFILVAFSVKKLSFFVLSYILANAVYGSFAFYLSLRSVKPLFIIDSTTIKNILKLALPLGVSSMFVMIGNRVSILMLAAFKSDYAVGIYSAAFKLIELSSFVAVMVTAPLLPIFAQKAKENKISLRYVSAEVAETLAIILLPIGIICFFLSEEVISLIYGNKFILSADVFRILIWVGIIVFYSLFVSNITLSLGVVNFSYWLGASSAIISIILNYLFIPRYSFIGSAWVALICEIFLAGTVIVYAIRNNGNFLRWRMWWKILALNILFFVFLSLDVLKIHIAYKFIISGCIYIFFIVKLDMIKRELLDIFFRSKLFKL